MPATQAKRSAAPPAPARVPARGRNGPDSADEIPSGILRMQADARALSRKLGRPLRTRIPDPLSEADWEELVLARILDYDRRIPAEELLEQFAHLRRKPRNRPR